MGKIEEIEFDSYELNANDHFFEITPIIIALMTAVAEGDKYKEALITKAMTKGKVFKEPEDFTLAEGVTTNGLIKTLMEGNKEEHERMIKLIRLKL